MFTPRQDAEARYYEISAIGTVTPVLEGLVDTKAWCPRRDTSLAHFSSACTSSSMPMRPFSSDLPAHGV